MRFPLRSTLCLPSCSLFALAGCGSEGEEPDQATTLYSLEAPAKEVIGESANPTFATLELSGGVMFVLGTKLLFLAQGQATPVLVHSAARFHDSLATDGKYVYFATQRADRDRFDASSSKEPPGPDGKLFRVALTQPFQPEPMADVNILVGRLELQGGHLFACESDGLNTEGALLDITTGSAGMRRHSLRVLEYCVGVAADESNVYLLVDRSQRAEISSGPPVTVIKGEESLVLSMAARSDATFWKKETGPTIVAVLPDKKVQSLYLRSDLLSLVSGATASVYTKAGAKKESFQGTSYGGAAVPLGAGQWVWARPSTGSRENGQFCDGGRIFTGAGEANATELTQNVCEAWGLSVGASSAYFIDTSDLWANSGTYATRYRLKSLPLPKR